MGEFLDVENITTHYSHNTLIAIQCCFSHSVWYKAEMSKGSFSPSLCSEWHFRCAYKIQNNTMYNSHGKWSLPMRGLSLTAHLFFLAVCGSSWFTALVYPMTHMCKGDKPAAVQHLPWLTPAPASASRVIIRSTLLGVWSGPDEIKIVNVGDVLAYNLLGYSSSPSWLLDRDPICLFSLSYSCNFILHY